MISGNVNEVFVHEEQKYACFREVALFVDLYVKFCYYRL